MIGLELDDTRAVAVAVDDAGNVLARAQEDGTDLMIVLSGASLVLPDRVLSPGTLVIEDGRIAEVRSDAPSGGHTAFAFHGHYIVPGFIDVHVHGVDGVDTLDSVPEGGAVAALAARLPRYGVTAFCPTTVACAPGALRGVLDQVRPRNAAAAIGARAARAPGEQFHQPGIRGRTALGLLTQSSGGAGARKGGSRAIRLHRRRHPRRDRARHA